MTSAAAIGINDDAVRIAGDDDAIRVSAFPATWGLIAFLPPPPARYRASGGILNIPIGTKVIQDKRLTLIRTLNLLTAEGSSLLEKLKAKVKAAMTEKESRFAESDLAVARLQDGSGSGGFIGAEDLYCLVKTNKITLAQFLSVVRVTKGKLSEFLTGEQIEKMMRSGNPASKSLVVEWKNSVVFDEDRLGDALLEAIGKLQTV